MNPEGVASPPGGYPNKNSNNRKIKSARWTMPRAPSVSFFPASLQHKEASAVERAPAMETTFKWRGAGHFRYNNNKKNIVIAPIQ